MFFDKRLVSAFLGAAMIVTAGTCGAANAASTTTSVSGYGSGATYSVNVNSSAGSYHYDAKTSPTLPKYGHLYVTLKVVKHGFWRNTLEFSGMALGEVNGLPATIQEMQDVAYVADAQVDKTKNAINLVPGSVATGITAYVMASATADGHVQVVVSFNDTRLEKMAHKMVNGVKVDIPRTDAADLLTSRTVSYGNTVHIPLLINGRNYGNLDFHLERA